jgi:hypothetical protein
MSFDWMKMPAVWLSIFCLVSFFAFTGFILRGWQNNQDKNFVNKVTSASSIKKEKPDKILEWTDSVGRSRSLSSITAKKELDEIVAKLEVNPTVAYTFQRNLDIMIRLNLFVSSKTMDSDEYKLFMKEKATGVINEKMVGGILKFGANYIPTGSKMTLAESTKAYMESLGLTYNP